MDCLSNFGHQGLFQKLTLPYEELEAFLQLLEVLFVQRVYFCGSGMALAADRNEDGSVQRRYFDAKRGFAGKRWGFEWGRSLKGEF